MRIVISSPDGIGDFVLREPLWAELVAQGNELLFLTRAATRDAVAAIVPRAQAWEIPGDPYEHFPERDSHDMLNLARRLREFRADLVVIAPYVHTWFDEWLARVLPNAASVGFAGRKYPAGVASLAAPLVERLTRSVAIAIDAPETAKNHALSEAVLERCVAWRAPRLLASPDAQQQIRARLANLAGPRPPFRVACVGDGPRNRHINWPPNRWAELLRHAISQHGWRFVLVGDSAERATNREIAELTGASASQLVCLDNPPLSFAELTALVSLAEGYIGRDTGPMHIAAAVGKPVLTVFAGGCWPRFLPAAAAGTAFALSVPCAGCGNFCHLPACYCIKELPLAPVAAGLDVLARQGEGKFSVRVLSRTSELAQRMEREAAAAGRERDWQLAQRSAPSVSKPAAARPPRRVHIGHHFFGAGNIGDDLMVAGFLSTLDACPEPLRFTCPLPHDIASQRRRFPQIEWVSYDAARREASIRACDAWLGLGDTPFQTDSGAWMLDHLVEELTWCQRYRKPMYFLGVGVNNRDAVHDPRAVAVLQAAAHLWTRDRQSAEFLAPVAGREKVTPAADLAHAALARMAARDLQRGAIGWVLNFENMQLFRPQAIEQCWRNDARQHLWQVQEIRPLPGSELSLWEMLSPAARTACRVRVEQPAYDAPDVEELLAAWTPVEILVSSRYHALVAGAWRGSRLVGVVRNDKVAGAIDELGIVRLDDVCDADAVAHAIKISHTASRETLSQLAQTARNSCAEFFVALQQLPSTVEQGPPTTVDRVTYGRGWHPLENAGDQTFRWFGNSAVTELWCDAAGPRRLDCQVAHVIHPQSRETLRLRVDGCDVPIVWDRRDPQQWSATIPTHLAAFADHLRIELSAAAFRPCDLNAESKDMRELSLAVSQLRLEPAS